MECASYVTGFWGCVWEPKAEVNGGRENHKKTKPWMIRGDTIFLGVRPQITARGHGANVPVTTDRAVSSDLRYVLQSIGDFCRN